ncbi:hypothetical protein Nepgr_029503 [Nepenthes gracilis]|uniref:Uncharacterized protein n=1 Tax=Nepenthes gracilis TaxID=150966 RepID=A0AAD3Y4W7_NEPGR|nr:hypothetical protein Nepgr_029503 [Nepenthes gracilis]
MKQQPAYNTPTLDEYEIYFSSLLSSPWKQARKPEQRRNQESHQPGYGDRLVVLNYGGEKGWEEDVNAEATEFIEQNHKNFELKKWMSMRIE